MVNLVYPFWLDDIHCNPISISADCPIRVGWICLCKKAVAPHAGAWIEKRQWGWTAGRPLMVALEHWTRWAQQRLSVFDLTLRDIYSWNEYSRQYSKSLAGFIDETRFSVVLMSPSRIMFPTLCCIIATRWIIIPWVCQAWASRGPQFNWIFFVFNAM